MTELQDTAAAKTAITEVIYRYCRAVDRMDRDMAAALFHPGATADYGTTFSGPAEALIDNLWANHAKLLVHSHQVTNILIEVSLGGDKGDRATSEAYAFGNLWNATDDGVLVVLTAYGRYLDRWSSRDGVWAIDHRRFVYDLVYTTTPSVAPEAAANPLAKLAARRDPRLTAARRDRTDPSYELMNKDRR